MKLNDRVVHARMGAGIVIGRADGKVTVEFESGETKTYVETLATASGALRLADAPAVKTKPTPKPEPAPAIPQEVVMPDAPHPLIPRLLDACASRGISRAEAIRAIGMSTGTWHALTHGKAGPAVIAKCEAWLAGQPAAAPAKAKATPATNPGLAGIRAAAEAMGLPIVRTWTIGDGALVEREAILL